MVETINLYNFFRVLSFSQIYNAAFEQLLRSVRIKFVFLCVIKFLLFLAFQFLYFRRREYFSILALNNFDKLSFREIARIRLGEFDSASNRSRVKEKNSR